ncbi:MAG: hypothetical protein QOF33_2998 [Thermomicrobiales bacterium]|jgi:hypothetical protein|nr:hypothetical protein [Thermomicrobiales bacterium]
MYVVIRRYSNATALADAMQQSEQEVRSLLEGVPGFVAYYATRDGGNVATITVCQDRAGTEESTRRAREWVSQNLSGATIGAPEVTEGETFIQF